MVAAGHFLLLVHSMEHSLVEALRLSRMEQQQVAELLEGRRSKSCRMTMLKLAEVQVQIAVPGLRLVYRFLRCMVTLVWQPEQLETELV